MRLERLRRRKRRMIQRYVSKISGPLLDRIDIHIEVPAVKYKELRAPSSAEDSASVRQRVISARDRQIEKFKSEKKTYANAQMMPKMIASIAPYRLMAKSCWKTRLRGSGFPRGPTTAS